MSAWKCREPEGGSLRGGQSQGPLSREIMAWGLLWGDVGVLRAEGMFILAQGGVRGQGDWKEARVGAQVGWDLGEWKGVVEVDVTGI